MKELIRLLKHIREAYGPLLPRHHVGRRPRLDPLHQDLMTHEVHVRGKVVAYTINEDYAEALSLVLSLNPEA